MKIPGLLAAIFLPALLAAQVSAPKQAPLKPTSAKTASPYAQVDAKALRLPDSATHAVAPMAAWIDANFSTPTERTRAIFTWIAGNIDYDVINMFALNFSEDTAAKIGRALQTRKGICVNYAADTIRLTPADTRIQKPLQQLHTSITDLRSRIKEEQDWLTKYLSKGRSGRKSMFYKYTWLGIPLN